MMPAVHRRLLPPSDDLRLINASRARLPPSPLLSARMITVTYLIATTIIIDQKIRLSTPRISRPRPDHPRLLAPRLRQPDLRPRDHDPSRHAARGAGRRGYPPGPASPLARPRGGRR